MMPVAPQTLAGTFVADPSHSSLQFTIKHMTVANFRAAFEDVEATVVRDEQGLRLDGRTRVESITIRTPEPFREMVVNSPSFFDAANHPTIEFRADEVDLREDGTVAVDGALTIRGIARAVSASGTYQLPVEDPFGNVRAAIELRAVIDRRDWGMDWQQPLPKGGDVLGWDVELTVHLALLKQS
jgi:polyisoprenoid-binding protein YceI